MPRDPGRDLSSAERLPTTTADIAHVAPDFSDRRVFNTLVIRPDLRISLRLGRIEELFPNQPNTSLGRMERLQVLGLFYFPLGHNRANTAFNGIGAPAAANRMIGAWEWFKTKILNNANDG